MSRIEREIPLEEVEEASLQGDHAYAPGTLRAALSHRYYRRFSAGQFASSIGFWMQSVALGALAYDLTGDARFVAGLEFARMAPMLLLSLVGGALADSRDRRRIILSTQGCLIVVSLALALVARDETPAPALLVACVGAFGIANALGHPAQATMAPHLVGRRDLGGALAVQSTQMNLSRVVGPAIGGVTLPVVGTAGIFGINAATYVLFIAAVLLVPRPPKVQSTEAGLQRLLGGFTAARRDPIVGRILLLMALLSLVCLPFVGLLPVLAAENLGLDLTGNPVYGFLYAAFGVGAAAGGLSVGTWLSQRPRHVTVKVGLAAWSVTLLAFGLNRSVAWAFPLAVLIGMCYFTTVTSLNTLLQEQVGDEVRGRVMALWIMSWGGMVPFGLLIGGQIAEATSMTVVTLYGAAGLAILALVTNLRPHPVHQWSWRRRTTPDTVPAR